MSSKQGSNNIINTYQKKVNTKTTAQNNLKNVLCKNLLFLVKIVIICYLLF